MTDIKSGTIDYEAEKDLIYRIATKVLRLNKEEQRYIEGRLDEKLDNREKQKEYSMM